MRQSVNFVNVCLEWSARSETVIKGLQLVTNDPERGKMCLLSQWRGYEEGLCLPEKILGVSPLEMVHCGASLNKTHLCFSID